MLKMMELAYMLPPSDTGFQPSRVGMIISESDSKGCWHPCFFVSEKKSETNYD